MILKRISPSHLQFFISDETLPENPVQGERIAVISTGECISVPCRYHEEGETELLVGSYPEVAEKGPPAFDGTIATPSGMIVFGDAELTEWLRVPADGPRTRIRIWTDGKEFPERVVVALG